MGYSGRYHAASLAAVFIALAIGILIGIGLADDVVSSASEELETSLRSDLSDAEDRADAAEAKLDRSDRFSEQVLTPLLENRLAGQKVSLVEFGGVPEALAGDARDAVEAAGGDLSSVARIALPPDAEALIGALPPRFGRLRGDPDRLTELGNAIGAGIARNGHLVEVLKPDLFESFTGNLRGADRVIVARADPSDLDAGEREAAAEFEEAIVAGIEAKAFATVGAELSTTDPSTLGPFIDAGLPTVDHLDLPAGKVSLVYALNGVEGNYGVKDEARSFLPDFQRGSTTAEAP